MAADEMKIKIAEELFGRMLAFYETRGINRFEKDTDYEQGLFHMRFTYTGEDFPMTFHVFVDAQHQLIRILSPITGIVPEERLGAMSMALTAINNNLINGCFTLDLKKGTILWRLTIPYAGSLISEEVFDEIIYISLKIVDKYNDTLLMLEKGMIDAESTIADLL